MLQPIPNARNTLLMLAAGLSIFGACPKAHAGVCSKEDMGFIKAAGFEISPYSDCIDEKVAGLVYDEALLSVVDPKAFTDVQHFVVNRKSGEATRIPLVFHRDQNTSRLIKEVFTAYLNAHGRMDGKKSDRTSINCAENFDNTSARIALSRRPSGYAWEYHILKPSTCDVREDFTGKATNRIGYIGVKQAVIARQLNGEFQFDDVPISYTPRQSFTRFAGGNSDVEAKMIAKPFFPRCRVKNNFSLTGAVSAVYNSNSPGLLKTDRALVVNKTGSLPAEIVTTPGENQKGTPVFLERKGIDGEIELAGAFKIADVRELDNLIVSGYPRDEVRVTIRDLECGRNVSTNWIPMDSHLDDTGGEMVTGAL